MRKFDNLMSGIAVFAQIDKAGDQYCSKLREEELESQIPIQTCFHP
jgi:hypothetical protein